ncbi:hypothetical protein PCASD_05390 [Puccinia coronata f. sp. avenae]|uniref:Uncharacterized protein n=1 Tax=Puccinia coronata f. sp. avenae TaxID=200324 RepID=A0A2N5S731_9BASI|nr:hypothetical protein PCASD_25399 [Puccinia coronata f. sp. avenae]PLW41612.1 hypothetical protein PCASD_05390 [Puccinia coronata f. sp. avenae]
MAASDKNSDAAIRARFSGRNDLRTWSCSPSVSSSLLLMRREGHSQGTPISSNGCSEADLLGKGPAFAQLTARGNLGFRFPESVALLNLDTPVSQSPLAAVDQ